MQAATRTFSLTAGTALLTCALAFGGLALPAYADDDDDKAASKPRSYPYVKGQVSIEVEHDNVFDADDPAAEITDTYTTSELDIGVYFSPRFSMHGHFTFEPVLDPEPGEDRFSGITAFTPSSSMPSSPSSRPR